MPASKKTKQVRAPYAPKVKTVSVSGATVNIGSVAQTNETVIVLSALVSLRRSAFVTARPSL